MRPAALALLGGMLLPAPPMAPTLYAQDFRPHGAAIPYALVPGAVASIFGRNLGPPGGCSATNVMDSATYKTELCGTRVLVGGIEALLIYVSESQINLKLPQGPWEDEMVASQIIRNGLESLIVPIRFGSLRPVVALSGPAYVGMPVWVRVEKPWGTGWLRYPSQLEPWDMGSGCFELRYNGETVEPLAALPYAPGCHGGGLTIALPGEVPERYLHRFPLHTVYSFDRAGKYEIRYTESSRKLV